VGAVSQSRSEVAARASAAGARRRAAARMAVGYALVLPAFLLVFVMLIYPLLYEVVESFIGATDFNTGGPFVGLANYARVVTNPFYWEAVRNTIFLVSVTGAVEMVVGVLTALLLWWKFWGRSLVFLAVFVPWAFPTSFSAYAWYWLLLPPFQSFYTQHAIAVKFWFEDIFGIGAYSVVSIATMNVWRGSSIIAIFVLAGLNAIPEELLDYGRIEARSGLRYLLRVVLPLVRRYLLLAVMIGLAITYMDYVSMYVESGGRIINPVVGTLVYQAAIQAGQLGYAGALNVTQLLVTLAIVLVGMRWIERPAPTRAPEPADGWQPTGIASRRMPAKPLPRGRSGVWRRRRRALAVVAFVLAICVMVFHLFPIYYTAVQAVRPLDEFHLGQIFWAYHPDMTGIVDAVNDPVLFQWGVNTFVVFGLVLVIGVSASLLAGYGLARFDVPGARWLGRLMFFAYFIPQMAVVLPMFQIYNAFGLDNTIAGIVLLYLTLTIPFATWLFYVYFLGLDREVEEHAWLDAHRRVAFFRVVIPMSWPVIIAAGLFAVGMMGSDVLYGSIFSLTNSTKTLPVGLGLTAIDLDEWANVNAAILISSLPIIVACAALGRYYVRGLRAALLEGA
jgi:multiple sugar transport system permease protein